MKPSLLILSLVAASGLAHAQIVMPDGPPPRAPGQAPGAMSAPANSLTGITNVHMNADTAGLDSTGSTPYFVFGNARAVSSTTNLSDYLKVRYPVAQTTLNLTSSSVEVFKGIGVYDEVRQLFMKNVPVIKPMTYAGIAYAAGSLRAFKDVNATKPFVLDLQEGQVIGFRFTSLSVPCYVALTRSATPPQATEFTGLVASNFYQSELGVLSPGFYYLWLKPQTGTASNVTFSFHNENAGTVASTSLVNGSVITGALRSNVRDYLKWKVRLTKDQDLFLTQTGGFNVQWRVIADDSTEVGSFKHGGAGTTTFGAAVNVPRTGDYYLVAEKAVLDAGSSVRATVNITQ